MRNISDLTITDSYVISNRLLFEVESEDKLTKLLDAINKAFELTEVIIDNNEDQVHRKGGYFLIGRRNLLDYPINTCDPFDDKSLLIDAVIPIGELNQAQLNGKKFITYRDMVARKARAIAGCCSSIQHLKDIREKFNINEETLPDGAIYDEKSGFIFAFSGFLMKKDLTLVLTFCFHAGIFDYDEVINYAKENDCTMFLDNLDPLEISPNTLS